MDRVFITSEVLPGKIASHALTQTLADRIAKAAKSGRYQVEYLGTGKPVFTSGGRYLSASHTGGRLYVAVACFPIGLDAELRREVPERVKREWLSPPEQKRDFFAVWTAKEAVAKLTGEGLSAVKRVLTEEHIAMLDGTVYSLYREEKDDVVVTVAARSAANIVWV